jgi:alkyl hydroperoxide reductase subunit AhpF
MPLLDEELKAQLTEEFAKLLNPVRLVVFSQALEDPESEQVARLVEELAALDSRITAESLNYVLDKARAEALGVTRTPAIAVMSPEKDYGIRLYGSPQGYEFGSLIDAILDVSRGQTDLAPETKAALARLERPLHLQVFSTPT